MNVTIFSLFLLPGLVSCEMFNIRAEIFMPPDFSQAGLEVDATVKGFANQLKFDGENWTLVNWRSGDGFGDNSTTCRGNLDLFKLAIQMNVRYMSGQKMAAWNEYIMELLPSLEITFSLSVNELNPMQPRCSGTSTCLTDECQCDGGPVFYCPGKLGGCIPFSQLCDGALCSQGWEWSCNVCRCEQLPPLT